MRKIYTLCLIMFLLVAISACKKNKTKKDSVEVTRYSAEDIYSRAKQYLDSGIWDSAITNYKDLRNQYPFGRFAEQGSIELAYSYYKTFDMDMAISTLERFIKNYPAHEHLDYAYYLKGLIYFESERGLMQRVHPDESIDRNKENSKLAFVAFKTFIEKFPNSKYAHDAEQRMVHLRNKMGAYELQVAKYYLRRKAYVASINRSKHVIEAYQKTDSVADAIAIMAESYKQLNQTELAKSSLLVLQTNFPSHSYLHGEDIDLNTNLFSLKKLWIFSRNK